MSTEINTGSLPVNISSSNSHKANKASSEGQQASTVASQPNKTGDTVSITDQVSRLQKIENQLADIPDVNSAKVAEIKAAIADGSFSIDPERVASKLIEMESGVASSDK